MMPQRALGRVAVLTTLLLASTGTAIGSARSSANAAARTQHREVERDETMLRGWLKGLPAGSGVIMVREQGELLLRFPASLLFESDSNTLSADAAQAIPLAATEHLLKRRKQVSARILVYADNIGGANINQSLTDQRAHALGDLLHQHGINTQRLSTQGAGSAEPVGDNETPEGRIQNRRVEIQLRRQ
jgi:outer membrane protein OmpA-like peptidoglycan-associated protein